MVTDFFVLSYRYGCRDVICSPEFRCQFAKGVSGQMHQSETEETAVRANQSAGKCSFLALILS